MRKEASWQHSPLLLETEICLWPLPRPPISSPCSHPEQVFRVLASLALGIRMDSPLQAQPDLSGSWCSVFPSILYACIVLIPLSSSNSRLSSLLSFPCSGHRNHSCPSFSDSRGLCLGPLSPGGALGFGWLVKSRGPAASHMVQKAVSPWVYSCAHPVFVWAAVSRYKNEAGMVSIL